MAARLKVFSWSDGFHSWTVATTSRAKALAAWEVGQDLFKSGLAHEVTGGPERESALASPGAVVKSGLAIDPGQIRTLKRKPAPNARQKRDAARIAKLEAESETVEAAYRDALDRLERQRATLEKDRDRIEAAHDKRTAEIRTALRALKNSGQR